MAAELKKSDLVSSMESEDHNDATYYYKNQQDFDDGMKFWYDAIIPETNTIAEKYFGNINTKSLDIVIFGDKKAMDDFLYIKDSIAFYNDNTIYVNNGTVDRTTFCHEYIHYITDNFCKENNISYHELPIWFVEGIAEYASLIPRESRLRGSTLEEAVAFKEINTNIEYSKLAEDGHNVFYQSYRILLRSKDMDFYAAFEEEVEMSMEEFQSLLEGLPSLI